ncbi:hypothetical protein [Helicobacter cetorum]|uniref:Uncharacterized protein n=1 Tax=Helicobacter cetorum (strain ATCC BAA-429 / MIT 00-7128) TaxID=182217 RepID=I0ELV0_HELC0|nr:hypothetical protein [Helicobacter cetorum]AFI03919.1 hypothetical protein HCW_03190 [Helicobacter cetorum MIT 00-7128]
MQNTHTIYDDYSEARDLANENKQEDLELQNLRQEIENLKIICAKKELEHEVLEQENSLNALEKEAKKYALKEYEELLTLLRDFKNALTSATNTYLLNNARNLKERFSYQLNNLPSLCQERKEQELERQKQIKKSIEQDLKRYKQELDKLESLKDYALKDYEQVKLDVLTLQDLLKNNIEKAHSFNLQVQSNIEFLPKICQRNFEEHQRLEQERQKAHQKALVDTWQRETSTWDSAIKDLAHDDLLALREKVFVENSSFEVPTLEKEILVIKEKYTQQLEKQRLHKLDLENTWAKETSHLGELKNLVYKELIALKAQIFKEPNSVSRQDIIKQIANIKEKYERQLELEEEQARQKEEQALKQELTNKLKNKPGDSENLSLKDLEELIEKEEQEEQERVAKEAVRKEMVKAIMESLNNAGFDVQKPTLNKEGEVIIRSNRTNGNRADFKINLSGEVNYHFDGYKGKACKNDIDKVLPRLNEVYGINLSNERVLWENPDDEFADAKPIAPLSQSK